MDFFTNLLNSPEVISLVMLAVGAGAGYLLKFIRDLVAKSENKLDDAIWNKFVGELVSVGTITPEQLKELKSMPPSGGKPQK